VGVLGTIEVVGGDERTTKVGGRGASPGRTLEPGSRVGSYRVEALLSTGGFGSVYKVVHVLLRRDAALKVLHPELVSSEEALARFEREARSVNMIKHSNVVDIYDIGALADGRPYFVMELLEGKDLEQTISQEGPLTPTRTLEILKPLFGALTAAHAKGIVHRDLKPSNVMLAEEDDGVRVVLLDFGVAKLLDANSAHLTTTRHVVGSPTCMAPEQIAGSDVDSRTDVYALGVLAFQMLAGVAPFDNPSVTVMQYLHLKAPRPRISTRCGVSAELDEVLTKAMSIRPEERFRTVHEFGAAVSDAVARHEAAVQAQPPVEKRAFAIHVRVRADARALEIPDETLLDAMRGVVPASAELLSSLGFSLSLETGESALFSRTISASDDSAQRLAGTIAAAELLAAFREGQHRDVRVSIDICCHVGSLLVAGDTVRGGESPTWSRAAPGGGLIATAEAIRDLDLDASPVAGLDGYFRLRD
jgi:serine/threonine-protein kinase